MMDVGEKEKPNVGDAPMVTGWAWGLGFWVKSPLGGTGAAHNL
jgi:hypothetical protein